MKRVFFFVVFALLATAATAAAQLPDFYKQVARVTWIVNDVDQVAAAWQKAGATDVQRHDDVTFEGVRFHGQPASLKIRAATARFDTVQVDWIQPEATDTVFRKAFLRKGEGIVALMHRVPDEAALSAEVARMKALGVGVLLEFKVPTSDGDFHEVYFDTEKEGKYVLGLVYDPTDSAAAPASGPKITQFAFVVRSLDPVSTFWAKLGLPKFERTHPDLTDLVYKRKPGVFRFNVGWQRHGKVVYEWIMPLVGPSSYHDQLAMHGEGFHHMAFNVDDEDAAIHDWESRGAPCVMSGGWGEKGKPGSGRFAYVSMQSAGGIDVELLWNYRGK